MIGVWSKAGFGNVEIYDNVNKGISFIISSPSKTWYPAASIRGASDNILYSGGYRGYYWSASPDSYNKYNAFCFYFYRFDDEIRLAESEYRAYGLAVRCFKE